MPTIFAHPEACWICVAQIAARGYRRAVASSSYLRYPHLSGDLVTFVAEDDIWLAPLTEAAGGGPAGGRAWRLTADQVPVLNPRLNPSGTRVAWTSTREASASLARGAAREVYSVPVDGGPVQRLTYWGDGRIAVRGWVSDDEVLVVSNTGQHDTMRTRVFAVPHEGTARLLPYGPASDVSVAANGAVLIGSPTYAEPARWKRYGGGTGGKIWYSPDGAEYQRILGEVGNHLVNPMWIGDRVVFLSDHEGVGALYSALPDSSDLRRHTELGAYYARHATTDGTRVVYQCAGDLWLLDSLEGEPVQLDIRLGGVRSGRAKFPVQTRHALGGFSLCKTGRVIAAEVRGTVHWLPAKDGPARTLLGTPGVRGKLPRIVPGTSTVVCVSDAGGEDGLDVIAADGSVTRRLAHGQLGHVLELAVSPDGKQAAVATHDGRLLLVALSGDDAQGVEDEGAEGGAAEDRAAGDEAGPVTELARSSNNEVRDLAFSPDSAYLAWAQPWNAWDASQIKLARLADRTIVDLTAARFDDSRPVFTHDGKHLAFLSNRVFDTVYDDHFFDLGFLPGVRPYLIPLAETTPSPFAPELNGRPVTSEKDTEGKSGKDKAAAAAAADSSAGSGDDEDADSTAASDAEAAARSVVVDLEGIADRVVPFPVEAGRYRSLRAVKGGVVWMDYPGAGELHEAAIGASDEHPKPSLVRYDLEKRKRSTIVEELDDFAVSADGARLAYVDGGEVKVKASDTKDDDETITVDLDRIRVTVDPAAEWAQMYGEAWRLMRDNFWRADMAGVDWPAMAERYRPLLDRIGSQDDLHDLIWEVQGELGASHAYVRPPVPGSYEALAQGLLGADLAPDEDGTWRIVRVLRGESSVIAARSPLAAPGVAAEAGDAIAAVDGQPVERAHGPNALLGGKAGKPVELTLRRDGAADRRVVVTPLPSESVLRYHDLIQKRRAAVHDASGGRLGYLHVPDMMSRGWAEFHRDLRSAFEAEGLVLDLRENGGGHTSQLVVEKLARKVIGWEVSRHAESVSYPGEAPHGPIVAVTDEFAGSDGDIATQAIKLYGIAPVIGMRTWGGVIGIDDRYRLVDGTGVTQPKFAFWFEGSGWGVENYGVDPDIEVPFPPHDAVAGRDPQLETAIRLALEAVESRPGPKPPRI
jgi:tricorn protease